MTMKDSWPLAVEVLAAGGTVESAAKAAQVTKQTVIRWKQDEPEFSDALTDARSAQLDEATGILTAACASWAQTLAEVATNPEVPAQFRVAAARAGLDAASRYRQDTQLEERIRNLEMAAGLRKVSA